MKQECTHVHRVHYYMEVSSAVSESTQLGIKQYGYSKATPIIIPFDIDGPRIVYGIEPGT